MREDPPVVITRERWAQGMTFGAYMARMTENREAFAANYAAVEIPAAVRAAVCAGGRPLKVLILTEDWCGDALNYLPIVGRLAACAGAWDLRVFLRDQNLDLADHYLNHGVWRSVPVVVFYDSDLRELGRFIEHPALAAHERQALIDALAADHAEVTAGRPYQGQSEEAQAAVGLALRALRDARKATWQQAVMDEVVAAAAQAGAPNIPT